MMSNDEASSPAAISNTSSKRQRLLSKSSVTAGWGILVKPPYADAAEESRCVFGSLDVWSMVNGVGTFGPDESPSASMLNCATENVAAAVVGVVVVVSLEVVLVLLIH